MPVYNCQQTLRAVLASLLGQSYPNFELLISDNASEDATADICREYALQDARIRYVRQPQNCGATANFQYVLDNAQGEFFMWAASDDIRSPDFIQHNLEFLCAHPDFVASTSPVRFVGGAFNPRKMGDASLHGPLDQRVCDFFRSWHANGRYYSLMRRSAIQDCPVVRTPFLGSDWAVVLYLIRQGKLHRVENGWLELGTNGASRGKNIFRTYRKSILDFFCPLASLSYYTWQICRHFPWLSQAKILSELVRLNLLAFASQMLVHRRKSIPLEKD
jgi:glycosyltransferase involved in cell wall biosynthesis